MVRSVAKALAHLHQRGVLHGDVYAHNILWNPATGDALLSDFGAATLLPLDQPHVCRVLMALEVRAFGCLLEELLAHMEPVQPVSRDLGTVMQKLTALTQACLLDTPSARPSMDDVVLHIS
jgi:serine/threonine protein kinase